MSNAVVDNDYYLWLLKQINYIPGDTYDKLLEYLHSVPFYWDVDNDGNRCEDGLQLRQIFMHEEGWNTVPISDEVCTVLEMFISLALRIENDIMWDGEIDRTSEWFWIMIHNLGFSMHNESNWNDILEIFMRRQYAENGEGGLFPLKNGVSIDQRGVEIWDQMQQYMLENYDF